MLFAFQSISQQKQYNNTKKSIIKLDVKEAVLDSQFIIPNTLTLSHQDSLIDDKWFKIERNTINFTKSGFAIYRGQIIQALFRVFDIDFEKKYTLRKVNLKSKTGELIPIEYDLYTKKNTDSKVFESNGLKYDGSFNRGFSVGNSQSLVLNSNFNLQLSGDLGNDMTISAAISDDNLPIQPEGNTQLLQEFDKVYMQIDRKNMTIVAGDYEIRRPEGYFINYNKRLQGLSVLSRQFVTDDLELTTAANYAISKGKFARNTFLGEEGNQGPYKLRSNNGERITKVLAGTEKVYIDGKLLTRGLEQDYIISYDRSELSFTDNFLITKDKRIVIEFEFADQNYVRSQYGTKAILKSKKLNLRFNLYNEQDNKNTTGDIDLDSLDLAILANEGDNIDQIFKDGSVPIQDLNEVNRALYRKVFEPSISDSILIFEPNPTIATHFANFSELGFGNGSYDIDVQNSINGRAYIWVGPGNGSYEAIIKIIPPERRFMFSMGSDYKITPNTYIETEFSMSNFDLNRFASKGNEDNTGIGLYGNLHHTINLDGEQKSKRITLEAKSELINKDFQSLNPYRNVEFTRDWNVNQNFNERESINTIGIAFTQEKKINLKYRFSNYKVSQNYDGKKHALEYQLSMNGLKVKGTTSLLHSTDNRVNTTFLRPFLSLEKSFGTDNQFNFGTSFDGENNQIKNISDETLTNLSQRFDAFQAFINYTPSDATRYQITLKRRDDFAPDNKTLTHTTQATELELVSKSRIGTHSVLDANFTIRDLEIMDQSLTTESTQKSYLGRLDYGLKLLKGGIRSNTSYQISSGQEPKLEYEFVEVQKGEGNYIWLDDGDDLQEINEFQIAPVQDTANFLRVAIINNEFIKTDGNSINQNTRIDFRNILAKSKDHFLKKISILSNIRIDHKAMDSAQSSSALFRFNKADSALVSFLSAQNHTLFFNKGNPTYDIQTGIRINQNKLVQITGFESFERLQRFLRLRWNYHKGLDLILNLTNGYNSADSEFFDTNDYNFSINQIEPQLIYRPTNKLRFKLNYSFDRRKNQPEILEALAVSHDFGLEVNLRKSNKLNINANINFIKVSYDGPKNGVLQLSMLEGLQDGHNFLWGINVIKRLSNNLDLIFGYDGRKTGTVRSIHTARAQAKLNF